ncbi:DUF4073 domain-containing protein [Salininema proteolyticum]|uniref:DUF4073 domain-containing protein n=1 Tax=Salininema proteolyticum TaxID=1607685 RepID=A0ABV8TXR1_9ACTN
MRDKSPGGSAVSRRGFLTTVTGAALATTGVMTLTGRKAHAAPSAEPAARLDVISDVQGDLADFRTTLDHLSGLGTADALVVNGDLVPNGYESQYEAYFAALDSRPHPDRVISVFGNHEQYNDDPFDTQVRRFLDWTGMPDVYSEQVVGGIPVLPIGTTRPRESNGGRFVTMGEAQLGWLESRLNHYSGTGKPVFICSHHVLPGTVSGSVGEDRASFYDQDFIDETELLTVLGAHPNVVFFSGHTHWDLNRDDWAAKKIVDGGDPRGFTVVNTGFVQTLYGPDGNGGEVGLDGGAAQGLRVEVDADGSVLVQARDLKEDGLIKTLAIPAPGTGVEAPQWEHRVGYEAGDVVRYEGALWTARWWNRNEKPRDKSGNAWVLLGEGAAPAWDPDRVYQGGDVVVADNVRWIARHWNEGEAPGATRAWAAISV